jgi:hypothetical protein
MATQLDPSITTADNLSGQVVARRGDLPEVRSKLEISVTLMDNMVAAEGEKPEKIHPLQRVVDNSILAEQNVPFLDIKVDMASTWYHVVPSAKGERYASEYCGREPQSRWSHYASCPNRIPLRDRGHRGWQSGQYINHRTCSFC